MSRLTDPDRQRIDQRLAELAGEAQAEGFTIREHHRDRYRRCVAFTLGVHPEELEPDELAEIDRRITATLYT